MLLRHAGLTALPAACLGSRTLRVLSISGHLGSDRRGHRIGFCACACDPCPVQLLTLASVVGPEPLLRSLRIDRTCHSICAFDKRILLTLEGKLFVRPKCRHRTAGRVDNDSQRKKRSSVALSSNLSDRRRHSRAFPVGIRKFVIGVAR
jgi:hypothetical protein